MSMRSQRGKITSDLLTQFEATQDAYADVIVKLNLILIDDKTHEEAVRTKLFEVMDERNKLGNRSISELHVMRKSIKEKVDSFLGGLNEQGVIAYICKKHRTLKPLSYLYLSLILRVHI